MYTFKQSDAKNIILLEKQPSGKPDRLNLNKERIHDSIFQTLR